MSNRRYLVLSIRQPHAERIFTGNKRFELRRVLPRIKKGDCVIIYAPKPIQALVGMFIAGNIIEGYTDYLWQEIGEYTGISKALYYNYFNGANSGCAIEITNPKRFTRRIMLEKLKKILPEFTPPQLFKYLNQEEIRLLGIGS